MAHSYGWISPSGEERLAPSAPRVLLFTAVSLVAANVQDVAAMGQAGDFGLDVTAILVAAVAMVYGPDVGLWAGGLAGLFQDLAVGTAPVGTFAFAGLVVGYVAGALWAWTVKTRWGLAAVTIALLCLLQQLLVHFLLWVGGQTVFWPDLARVSSTLLHSTLLGGVAYLIVARFFGQSPA